VYRLQFIQLFDRIREMDFVLSSLEMQTDNQMDGLTTRRWSSDFKKNA